MIAGRSRDRPAPDHHRHERHGDRVGLAAEQVLDDLLALAHGERGVGQRGAQLVVGLEGPGEAEELVLHLGQVALGAGDGEQRRSAYAMASLVASPESSLAAQCQLGGRCHRVDVVLDELRLGGGVEVAPDDDLGGTDGQLGDLAPQVGDGLDLGGLDVGRGLGAQLGQLGLQPGLLVALQGVGGLPGLLDDPAGLGLGVGELGPVVGQQRVGLGALRSRRRRGRCGSARCGRSSTS